MDCLEHILKHLCAEDLLYLAHTSKLMKKVADLIIKQMVRKIIIISMHFKNIPGNARLVREYDVGKLDIVSAIHSFKFLR